MGHGPHQRHQNGFVTEGQQFTGCPGTRVYGGTHVVVCDKEIWRWCGGGGGGGVQGRRKVTSEPAAVSQTHVNTSSSDKSSNGGIPKFKFSLLFNLQTQNTSSSME